MPKTHFCEARLVLLFQEAFPKKLTAATKRESGRSKTWDMPSFSDKCQLAKDFVSWICSAGGGGKDLSQAEQLSKKILQVLLSKPGR
ncbi:MAG: hypothetical protein AAFY76_05185 [Cyanobacteria bacterium J06649_11]